MSGTTIIAQISMSLKGSCTGSSESTLVKMPHFWKSYVAAHIMFCVSGYMFAAHIMFCVSGYMFNSER